MPVAISSDINIAKTEYIQGDTLQNYLGHAEEKSMANRCELCTAPER